MNAHTSRLLPLSRILLVIGALALFAVNYLPMWRIDLDAPQYPEGLALQIHTDKLAGDVEIINGLNHYIGMKTLHTEDFIEFTVLPYIVWVFAALFVLVAVWNRRSVMYVLFVTFIAFCILAMADFWRWEYEYGHDLDPNAAIQVPGMAYQPPLIGFKQLLNFGAYSIPDTGGWCFVAAAVLLTGVAFWEWRRARGRMVSLPAAALLPFLMFFTGCREIPEPIEVGKDACVYCKMAITDERFAAEIVSDKNKVFKFDDIFCVEKFVREGKIKREQVRSVFICDYLHDHAFIPAEKAFLYQSIHLHSPMNGNIAAFGSEADLLSYSEQYSGFRISWEEFFQ